jgi:hypothetical protein
MTWKADVRREDYDPRVKLRIWRTIGDEGEIEVFTSANVLRVSPMEVGPDGAFLETAPSDMAGFLQALVDAAWQFGIRPGVDMKGMHEAQGRHLEDMRALVAHSAGCKLP